MSEGFLSRWSRRKIETQEEASSQPVHVVTSEPQMPVVDAEVQSKEVLSEEQADVVTELPDIETLNAESDFTAFLQKGVPEELQKLALRKLWRSNPIFANLDGLNDYDEDFTKITPLAEGLAEELKKLMKDNSRTEPEPEEEEGEGDEEAQEVTEGDEVFVEKPEDDDHDVDDGEDDF